MSELTIPWTCTPPTVGASHVVGYQWQWSYDPSTIALQSTSTCMNSITAPEGATVHVRVQAVDARLNLGPWSGTNTYTYIPEPGTTLLIAVVLVTLALLRRQV